MKKLCLCGSIFSKITYTQVNWFKVIKIVYEKDKYTKPQQIPQKNLSCVWNLASKSCEMYKKHGKGRCWPAFRVGSTKKLVKIYNTQNFSTFSYLPLDTDGTVTTHPNQWQKGWSEYGAFVVTSNKNHRIIVSIILGRLGYK